MEENTKVSSEPSQNEHQILIEKLEEKCNVANKDEKEKIISLLPDSWSKNKICKEFNVSEYHVRLTRELVKNQGIHRYHYCSEKITGFKYVFVSTDEIQEKGVKLKKRFDCCLWIQVTRSYHRFLPVNENEIRCFKTSKCEEYGDHKISLAITGAF